jgi:hypothetical protein
MLFFALFRCVTSYLFYVCSWPSQTNWRQHTLYNNVHVSQRRIRNGGRFRSDTIFFTNIKRYRHVVQSENYKTWLKEKWQRQNWKCSVKFNMFLTHLWKKWCLNENGLHYGSSSEIHVHCCTLWIVVNCWIRSNDLCCRLCKMFCLSE